MLKKKQVILMAVSSSGGHIYPALALAEKLSAGLGEKERDFLETHFVYPPTPLAEEILSSSPYPCHPLALGGMAGGQKLFRKLKTLFQLPLAFFKALFLIKKIKADLILGTGGSLTVPVLTAGFLLRKNRAIWEGNTQLGLANKVLSVFTEPVFTAFPDVTALNPKKQVWSAYPLRNSLSSDSNTNQNLTAHQNLSFDSSSHSALKENQNSNLNPSHNQNTDSNKAQKTLNPKIQPLTEEAFQEKEIFPKEKFKVLILGGSQGSVFFNQVVSSAMEREDWRKDLFIYHQTGERSFKSISAKYQSLKNISVFPFTKNIRAYYQNCDLIFSRAGAGSIWESAHFSKSLVLIPLTRSAGAHQLKNAVRLFEKSCADLILEKDFKPETFKEKLLSLKNKPQKRKQLGENLNQIQKKEDKILEWIKQNSLN